MGRFGEDLNEDSGAIFFHLSGKDCDVESALFHEEARDMSDDFG